MKDKDYNEKDNYDNENIDEYITNVEVNLGNMEKVAVAFLVAGYSNYIYAANLDILDAQDRNNNGETSEEAFLFSQKLVVLGYILLWIVASARANIKEISNIYNNERNDIAAYQNVANSYALSIFANVMRLEAFNKLYQDVKLEKPNEEEG